MCEDLAFHSFPSCQNLCLLTWQTAYLDSKTVKGQLPLHSSAKVASLSLSVAPYLQRDDVRSIHTLVFEGMC